MPGIIKVKIHEAKDLPVMDRASDLTDAFVEVRHGATIHKTDVCRKSLNPTWNSEWLRFEADDEQLQDEPLQVKVMDYDIYSAHDTIGKVMIGLSSLLLKNGTNEMGGWFPIYDTLHGIRGYIQISVKIEFFVDANKYRQTSCGVRFFSTSAIPSGFVAVAIQGFVDVLVVNDDPEYQWIDKIRTPRASNDARIRLFSKLSGEVNRRLGLKVLDAGGNAVIGYCQCFDIEGDTGIVVRGIGTCVTLVKIEEATSVVGSLSNSPDASMQSMNNILNDPVHAKSSFERVRKLILEGQKKRTTSSRYNRTVSSSSEGNEIINETSLLLNASGESPELGFTHENVMNTPNTGQKIKSVGDFEFPFFTIVKAPHGFIIHLGGLISSKSVKLLDEINNPDGPETREAWWHEIRTEMRSHAKALGCNAVIGYVEHTTICDDVVVLSAMGTAAIIRLPDSQVSDQLQDQYDESDCEGRKTKQKSECENEENEDVTRYGVADTTKTTKQFDCRVCHLPFNDSDLPFIMNLSKCTICKHGKVADIIFATIEPPPEIIITGSGCIIQARVYRTKKREKDEAQAESVSQILPFLEYELHRQLMNKLKMKGMNSVFGVRMQISVGENIVIGLMTGTAMYVTALPVPPLFVVSGSKNDSSYDEKKLLEMQKRIIDETTKNRAQLNLFESLDVFSTKTPPNTPVFSIGGIYSQENTSCSKFDDIQGQLDLANGVKETYVITIDDNIEDEILSTLTDPSHIDGGHAFNTESTPGVLSGGSCESQFMTIFHRKKLNEDDLKISVIFQKMCEDLTQALHFKLRNRKPYFLNKVTYNIKVPEDNELQVTLTAFASVIGRARRQSSLTKNIKSLGDNDGCLFSMEVPDSSHRDEGLSTTYTEANDSSKDSQSVNLSHTWPTNQFNDIKNLIFIHGSQHHDIHCEQVIISPLSVLPNKSIELYIGNLNLFFIRETTAVKEDGGLNMFMQTFIAEVHAIVRSQVAALSGDGLMSFTINDITLLDSSHKNQGQCLLNASGDVVKFVVDSEMLSQLATSTRHLPQANSN